MSEKLEMGDDSRIFQEQWIKNYLSKTIILDTVRRLKLVSF
jgi:hypothetical protein